MGMNRFVDLACAIGGDGLVADAIALRLEREGGRVARLIPAGELGDHEAGVASVADAAAALGGLDVLVTAYHERSDRSFLQLDDETWQRTLDANLTSAFVAAQHAARIMVGAGHGVIVHVGSVVGARPGPRTAAYASAKAGVHLLAMAMALDLAPDGVRVCAVAAPESASNELDQSLGPEDVSAAVAFCASADASYVLGSTFYLDGPLPVRG